MRVREKNDEVLTIFLSAFTLSVLPNLSSASILFPRFKSKRTNWFQLFWQFFLQVTPRDMMRPNCIYTRSLNNRRKINTSQVFLFSIVLWKEDTQNREKSETTEATTAAVAAATAAVWQSRNSITTTKNKSKKTTNFGLCEFWANGTVLKITLNCRIFSMLFDSASSGI